MPWPMLFIGLAVVFLVTAVGWNVLCSANGRY